MHLETMHTSIAQRRTHTTGQALLSALVPGLGQAAQGRLVTAGLQFGTVAAYLAGAFALGGRRAILLAVAWNVWSVIDAYRHETD